jgi:hypothetical protein
VEVTNQVEQPVAPNLGFSRVQAPSQPERPQPSAQVAPGRQDGNVQGDERLPGESEWLMERR